jgi:hypothetical protein
MLDLEAKVCELIDRNTSWWNTDLIGRIFPPQEARAILSIPLSSTNQRDIRVWRCTPKGLFTVRSAYHLAKTVER